LERLSKKVVLALESITCGLLNAHSISSIMLLIDAKESEIESLLEFLDVANISLMEEVVEDFNVLLLLALKGERPDEYPEERPPTQPQVL